MQSHNIVLSDVRAYLLQKNISDLRQDENLCILRMNILNTRAIPKGAIGVKIMAKIRIQTYK